ncbi:MAG: hypothetical protein R3C97_17920 [Geminicoccaceae bacterium]
MHLDQTQDAAAAIGKAMRDIALDRDVFGRSKLDHAAIELDPCATLDNRPAFRPSGVTLQVEGSSLVDCDLANHDAEPALENGECSPRAHLAGMDVHLRPLLGRQPPDHGLHGLAVGLVGDEDRIGRLDHREIADTRERHEAVLGFYQIA